MRLKGRARLLDFEQKGGGKSVEGCGCVRAVCKQCPFCILQGLAGGVDGLKPKTLELVRVCGHGRECVRHI
jgi:hypothetical protein